MAWTDSLGAQEALRANVAADSAANLNDPLTRLIGDHFVNIPDDLNQWADALAASRPVWLAANPAADAMAMSDTLGVLRNLFAGLGPDSAANLADSLGALFSQLARLTDDGNQWNDQIAFELGTGFLALTANLPPDSVANLADTLTAILQLRAAILDDANTLNDPLPRLIGDHFVGLPDDLNQWADQLAVSTAGLLALLANLPPDSGANLLDSLTPAIQLRAALDADSAANLNDTLGALYRIFANLTADDANNFADPLPALIGGYSVSLDDNAANLLDSFAALRALRVALSDDAANLADALAKFLTGLSALTAELTDNANTWNDSIAGRFEMFAALVDSAANLLDALNARMALLAALTDNANNWNDSAAGFHRLFANLGADAWGNLVDSISASTGAQLFLNLSDAMANLADTLAGAKGLLAASTDSAANLADSAAMRETLGAQLTDAADNLADAIAGFHELFADLDPDTAANLADVIAASAFSVIFYIYAWTILGPEFVLGQAQPVFQGKELSAEYTLREAA